MILKECVESKYAAQAVHYKKTGGDPAKYAKLLQEKYKETLKERAKRQKELASK